MMAQLDFGTQITTKLLPDVSLLQLLRVLMSVACNLSVQSLLMRSFFPDGVMEESEPTESTTVNFCGKLIMLIKAVSLLSVLLTHASSSAPAVWRVIFVCGKSDPANSFPI